MDEFRVESIRHLSEFNLQRKIDTYCDEIITKIKDAASDGIYSIEVVLIDGALIGEPLKNYFVELGFAVGYSTTPEYAGSIKWQISIDWSK